MVVAQASEPDVTPQEYLEAERASETRHEYVNGRIYAMSAASLAHITISANGVGLLHAQLRGKSCRPLGGAMRVKVDATGLYTYPDAMISCEPVRLEDDHFDTLLNPTVIIEVLSPSTEAYDRGEKFAHYRNLESLTDYLLIAQDSMRLEDYRRLPNNDWMLHVAEGADDEVVFEGVGCRLRLADVYERVKFEAAETGTAQAPSTSSAS